MLGGYTACRILSVWSVSGNRNRIPLNRILFNGIPFPFVSIKKSIVMPSLKVPFSFISVKTNFESSVKILFPLMTLCFHINPYHVPSMSTARIIPVILSEGLPGLVGGAKKY